MSWTLIEHQALSSSVASVTLGNGGTIPQTYKTLKLVVSARSSWASTSPGFYFSINGSSSTFTFRTLYGNGTTATSANGSTNYFGNVQGSTTTASTFSSLEYVFPNYSGSTNKVISCDEVIENNATRSDQIMTAVLWSTTSAVTSMTMTSYSTGNFVAGSTFTLYGLK